MADGPAGSSGGEEAGTQTYIVPHGLYLLMKDLEQRKADAEFRAATMEEKLRVMEQQLAAVHWKPGDFEQHIQHLEQQCRSKDQQLQELTDQLGEQRQLRQQDARCVEEKAARIKDWVTNKLSQLEQQNHELLLKNEMLTDQVETLRERLHSLPPVTAKHIHRISNKDDNAIDNYHQTSTQEATLTFRRRSRSPTSPSHSVQTKTQGTVGVQVDMSQVEDIDTLEDDIRPISEMSSSISNSRLKDFAGSRPVSSVTGSRPDSFLSSFTSRPHKRPSSSIIEALEIEQELFSYGLDTGQGGSMERDSLNLDIDDRVSGDSSDESMADIDYDPLYQEVDQNHESVYEPKRTVPPQIRIERKIFQEVSRMDSFVSSSNDSEDIMERMQKPIYATIDKKPTLTVEPMSRSVGFDPDARSSGAFGALEEDMMMPLRTSPITLTPRSSRSFHSPRSPRSPLSPVTPQLPDLVTTPTMHRQHAPFLGLTHSNSSSTVSAIATLPRRPRSKPPPPPPLPVHFDYEDSVISQLDQPMRFKRDSHVVCAEVHSAPATVTRPDTKSKQTTPKAARARFNTWSTKAYSNIHRDKHKQEHTVLEPSAAVNLFRDISVPVFATLKGRARQIRNTPFTEESDESSDDDGASDVEGVPLSPRSPKRNRPQLNHSTSGAVKRGVCRHSVSSDVSGDYANPPDNVSTNSDSDTSEPEQKLLKYTDEAQKHDTLDKCGYLSKLGGKVKTWKKRWFVLRGTELFYYKTQHDMLKKPQGCIKLDDQTKISRTHGELTFEITVSKRTYYLSADTYSETDRWVRVLQKLLKRQANSYLLEQVETKAVIRGFLTKVKNGVTRKCWCVLLGGYFLYYRSPSNKTPFGQIHLHDARLEEIDTPTESDEESDVTMPTKHVIAIWPPYQGPTYLIVPTKQEKDSWLYHLTVAAGGGTGNVGTQYEQLIAKLMQENGDPNSVYWKHPIFLHTKDPPSFPLTTLPSKQLQRQAVELFKTVQQFMYTMIESQSLDDHVTLAQSILHQCVVQPSLQNELFCQLIKQTSKHPIQNRSTVQNLLLCGKHSWYMCHTTPTSPTNSLIDLTTESKLNPASYVVSQGWQLLAMCVSLFIPKQSIMWHLKLHLQRNADQRTDVGKYATFCQRALDRTLLKGLREVKPSRMEVMSMLLRHPYHHSQPISIPVHFLNASYQVVSFDGSTTVQEFLMSLSKTIGVQDFTRSGFALFSDDPVNQDVDTCLQSNNKICDIISRWEEAYREYYGSKLDTNKTIRLLYKNRLYFKSCSHMETDREKLLLTYQINDEIINGRFPLNRDLALELASLMAQIEYGDMKGVESGLSQQAPQALDRFYPRKYRDHSEDSTRSLQERLVERWTALRGRLQQDCVRVYLAVARKWQFCGATLFLSRVRDWTSPDDVWLAVQEEGVAVLEYSTMQPISLYDYRSVVTFGGWNNDLMIVVSELIESGPHHYEHRTDKLLFVLQKAKVLEATHLIASYINARAQRCSRDVNGSAVL